MAASIARERAELAMSPRRTHAKVAGGARRPLRVLTLTTLYPNTMNARHGIFVETRLRKLVEAASVDLRVIAPVPWFPFSSPAFGRYARFAKTPRSERRHDIEVTHPRYFVLPKVGQGLQPRSLARCMEVAIEELLERGWTFDVIDAHYFYPDGVAASAVARRFARPLVITARGSDVNLIAKSRGPWRMMREAAEQATRVIAVSAALKQALIELGLPDDRVEVLRNGVDTNLFRPRDRERARATLGISAVPLVASVGNLVREKGHDLVLAAVARLDGAQIIVVGSGPEKRRLQALASSLGLDGRARFIDNVSQEELSDWYGAADLLALGSTREGWPNVLLESMACGTPVVATDVGGVREIVGDASVGKVVTRRDPEEFASGMREVLARGSDRRQVRAYACQFDWASVAARYYDLLNAASIQHGGSRQ